MSECPRYTIAVDVWFTKPKKLSREATVRLRHIVKVNKCKVPLLKLSNTVELTAVIHTTITTRTRFMLLPLLQVLCFIGRTFQCLPTITLSNHARGILRSPKVRHVDQRCLHLCQSSVIGLDYAGCKYIRAYIGEDGGRVISSCQPARHLC